MHTEKSTQTYLGGDAADLGPSPSCTGAVATAASCGGCEQGGGLRGGRGCLSPYLCKAPACSTGLFESAPAV